MRQLLIQNNISITSHNILVQLTFRTQENSFLNLKIYEFIFHLSEYVKQICWSWELWTQFIFGVLICQTFYKVLESDCLV